jgi:hypothetical protein
LAAGLRVVVFLAAVVFLEVEALVVRLEAAMLKSFSGVLLLRLGAEFHSH